MNTIINELEQIDSKLESLNSQSILLIGNVVSWGRENVDLVEVAEILTQIASLPKSMQDTVLESIHAKIKSR
jgi:hypothetical protein